MPIYLWTGEESFLIQEKRATWTKAFVEKHGDMNVSVIDGLEMKMGELISHIETVPFLAEKRLVFIKDLPPSSKVKFDSEKAAGFIESLKTLAESIIVVFLQPEPDKRSSFYKQIKDIATVEEFFKLQHSDLHNWIQKRVEQRGGKILPAAIPHLIEVAGTDLWLLGSEIDKLLAYTAGEKVISENDIDKLVSSVVSANVFHCIDAISEKKKEKALRELSAIMQQGESLMQFFALFIRQIRLFILAKSLASPTKDVLVQEFKVHPFVAQKILHNLKLFSMDELKALYQKFLDIDLGIKTGKVPISTGNEKALALELEKIILHLS